ncbi:MAG: hypothetical protein QXT43_02080 [Candidatus Micrarchaeaceae archaeon]
METKKLIELLGSLFIAVIFISSYAAFGTGSSVSSNSSVGVAKAKNSTQLFYGVAFAKARIVNYTNAFSLAYNCSGSNATRLNETLAAMLYNGSIANYYPSSAASFYVDSGNESTTSILVHLYSLFSCVSATALAEIELPSNESFYFSELRSSANLEIPASLRSHSMLLQFAPNASSVNVSISVLASSNGVINSLNASIEN